MLEGLAASVTHCSGSMGGLVAVASPVFFGMGHHLQGFTSKNTGFDHGVGHPLLLLCDAKAPNFRKNKAFKDLSHYAEWPKVADAVIEAVEGFSTAYIWQRRQGGNKQEIGHAYRVAYGWGNPATGIENDHLIRFPQWGECPPPGVFSPLEGEDGNLRHCPGSGLRPLKR
jgi:hypothetical protein